MAVALPAALLVTIPLLNVLNPSIFSDTFGLIPLLRLSERLSGGVPFVKKLLISGGVVGRPALRVHSAPVCRPGTGRLLSAFSCPDSSYSVHGAIRDYSANLAAGDRRAQTIPTWIDDRAGGRDVGVLYGNASDTFQEAVALWQPSSGTGTSAGCTPSARTSRSACPRYR